MNIQELKTEQERKDFLTNIFTLLVTELPQEGMQFIETDEYIALKRIEAA